MEMNCNEAEGARLLETMRRICDKTGCKDVEHATLSYEETLQEKNVQERNEQTTTRGGMM